MCGRIPILSEGAIYGSFDKTKIRCFCETTYNYIHRHKIVFFIFTTQKKISDIISMKC